MQAIRRRRCIGKTMSSLIVANGLHMGKVVCNLSPGLEVGAKRVDEDNRCPTGAGCFVV